MKGGTCTQTTSITFISTLERGKRQNSHMGNRSLQKASEKGGAQTAHRNNDPKHKQEEGRCCLPSHTPARASSLLHVEILTHFSLLIQHIVNFSLFLRFSFLFTPSDAPPKASFYSFFWVVFYYLHASNLSSKKLQEPCHLPCWIPACLVGRRVSQLKALLSQPPMTLLTECLSPSPT